MTNCAYIFLDEAGNFDFSSNGTRYFVLTGVSLRRPFLMLQALDAYKHDLLESGRNIEYFHCTRDRKEVRSQVFDLITNHIDRLRVDCLVTEKSTVGTKLRQDIRFYPRMLGYLLKKILHAELAYGTQEFIVITDSIPLHNRRHAIAKAVKSTLTDMLPGAMEYRIMHHSSRSHYGLQVADYCSWAIFRKWERGDDAYYHRIRQAFGSENWMLRRATRRALGKS